MDEPFLKMLLRQREAVWRTVLTPLLSGMMQEVRRQADRCCGGTCETCQERLRIATNIELRVMADVDQAIADFEAEFSRDGR